MSHASDDKNAKADSAGLFRRVKWFVLLPLPVLLWGFRWLKNLVVTPKTEKQSRGDEKARQAALRRELRGLPPEHDPAANPKK